MKLNQRLRSFQCRAVLVGCSLAMAVIAGCGRQESAPEASAPLTAESIIREMVDRYQSSPAYRDAAVVRLQYRQGGRAFEDEAPLSVSWQAPNQVSVRAYQVQVASDGDKLYARLRDPNTNDLDGQVVVRPAPQALTLKDLYEVDDILSLALRQGLAGYPLQLDLLLSDEPLAALRADDVVHELLDPAEIDGDKCHRVNANTSDGEFVLWIDQQASILRRVEFPVMAFAPDIAGDSTVEDLRLTAEFRNVQFRPQLGSDTFAFNVPAGAKRVKRFIPPPGDLPSELFGQTAAPYAFADLSSGTISDRSLADRIKVLMWFNDHPACQSTVQQINQVYQHYRSNQRVAIHAVCAEPSDYTNEQITRLMARWKVDVPVVRDADAYGRDLFRIPWAPTMVVLDGKNVVQIVEVGANPNLVAELPQVLDRLLAGEDLAAEILEQARQEHAAYEDSLKRGEPESAAEVAAGPNVAPESSPQLLQLRPIWKNSELKSTGNILAINEPGNSTRFLVHEGWRTITELDSNGSVVARHSLDLPKMAAVSQIRSAVDRQGNRYYVVWSFRNFQAHVLNDRWQRVASYPPAATKHDGVQEALLADIDEDGRLELYVGFWGAEGVHCVDLNGRKQWACGEASHVLSIISLRMAAAETRLWVASADGTVLKLDSAGHAQPLDQASGQLVHHLFGGTDDSPTADTLCGVVFGPDGRRLALGLTGQAEPKWRYNLPAGSFPTQTRFVSQAQLLASQDAQWLIAAADGSLHIISTDGRFTDYFQTGRPLFGLAGGRYRDQGILVVSSDEGVRAWEVLPPKTASRGQ